MGRDGIEWDGEGMGGWGRDGEGMVGMGWDGMGTHGMEMGWGVDRWLGNGTVNHIFIIKHMQICTGAKDFFTYIIKNAKTLPPFPAFFGWGWTCIQVAISF